MYQEDIHFPSSILSPMKELNDLKSFALAYVSSLAFDELTQLNLLVNTISLALQPDSPPEIPMLLVFTSNGNLESLTDKEFVAKPAPVVVNLL